MVIVNGVYPPEPLVTAQMGRDLAVRLVQDGSRVTVLCPYPSRPKGVRYAAFQASGSTRVDMEDGVEVVRLPSFTVLESKIVARARESFSFGLHACRYLRHQSERPDVLYVNAWPLLGPGLLAWYARHAGVPMVLHVQDVYPESLLAKLPGLLRGTVAGPLTMLDRWIARQAYKVVVISANMRRIYVESRHIAPEKVVAINNWQDEHPYREFMPRPEACARYGVPEDRFTYLYLGNIGPVAGVDLLIRAFHEACLEGAQLVIIGDGSAKDTCEKLASRLQVRHVRFISDPDIGNVSILQSMAHVCMLPVRHAAGMSSVPSKLVAYLFSAKPVMATVDAESDTARVIREAGCGWVGSSEDVAWLAAKMAEVKAMPQSELVRIGLSGRKYALEQFSKAVGTERLASVVTEVTEQPRLGGKGRCLHPSTTNGL